MSYHHAVLGGKLTMISVKNNHIIESTAKIIDFIDTSRHAVIGVIKAMNEKDIFIQVNITETVMEILVGVSQADLLIAKMDTGIALLLFSIVSIVLLFV
jgi:hypothetical protein